MSGEHWTLEDFEQLNFGPCICGCEAWVEWNDEEDRWVPCDDPYRYYIVDPEFKTKGDDIVALVVRRG